MISAPRRLQRIPCFRQGLAVRPTRRRRSSDIVQRPSSPRPSMALAARPWCLRRQRAALRRHGSPEPWSLVARGRACGVAGSCRTVWQPSPPVPEVPFHKCRQPRNVPPLLKRLQHRTFPTIPLRSRCRSQGSGKSKCSRAREGGQRRCGSCRFREPFRRRSELPGVSRRPAVSGGAPFRKVFRSSCSPQRPDAMHRSGQNHLQAVGPGLDGPAGLFFGERRSSSSSRSSLGNREVAAVHWSGLVASSG